MAHLRGRRIFGIVGIDADGADADAGLLFDALLNASGQRVNLFDGHRVRKLEIHHAVAALRAVVRDKEIVGPDYNLFLHNECTDLPDEFRVRALAENLIEGIAYHAVAGPHNHHRD